MQYGIGLLGFSPRFLRQRREISSGIKIRGNAEFRLRTQQALALLRPLGEFEIIQANLGGIRQGKHSGMKAWVKPPTFIVGKPTWNHSALWYASAIAHDAYHAALYSDARKLCPGQEPGADSWTGAAAEKRCLAFQRQVLCALNADERIINYVDRCAQNPTYQGYTQGWRSWLDYLGRRW